MSTAASPTVVQLHWDMRDGSVTVTPEDQDRFGIKVGRAIEILQQAARAEQFERQFHLLLRVLGEWISGRQGHIERAYITHRDGALAFVVVCTALEYDDDFEGALSDLDFRIANDPDLDLIKIDAIALPLVSESAATSFLDQDFVLEYIGHGD
jgi:hypothetical protein